MSRKLEISCAAIAPAMGLIEGEISCLNNGIDCEEYVSSCRHVSEQYSVDVLGTILSQTEQYC